MPLAGMYALYQRAVIYISEHYQMLTGMFEPIPLGNIFPYMLQQPGAWVWALVFCQLFYHPPSLEGIGKEDVNEDKTLDLCGSAVRRSFDGRYGGIFGLRHQCGDRGCQETGICFGRGKEEGGEYLNQLEGLKADTAAYVKKLDGSLSSLAEELEQLGNRITLKEEEIDQAQIQLEEARREEEHQYDSMKLRIKYMYENGQNNLLDMVMESGSISELLNRAEYVSQIAEYDRKMLTAYASAKEQVAAREQNLEKEHGELLVLQESTQAKQASMQQLMDSKQKELDSYNSKIAMPRMSWTSTMQTSKPRKIR